MHLSLYRQQLKVVKMMSEKHINNEEPMKRIMGRKNQASYYDHPAGRNYYSGYEQPRLFDPDNPDKTWKTSTVSGKVVKDVDLAHEILTIKDLLKGILNTLDEQQLSLENHGEMLNDLCDIILDNDD